MNGKESLLSQPSETTAPYWEAIDDERFELQQCRECREWIYYPREMCPHCYSNDLRWSEASDRGEILTYSTLYHTPVTAYEDNVPYVLAIATLEDGPQMMANVVNCDPEDVEIGREVSIVFEERGDRKLPQFELRSD